MKKILSFLTGNVLSEVGKVFDKLFTNDEERQLAKNELARIIQKKELELRSMQTDIIIAEANGNWLQRSWRPILMLSFGFIIVYCKFIAPLFDLKIPLLEDDFWSLLQIGIGGYVVGRSAEKIADKVTINKK
jgi:hypothetical protein